MSITSTMSLMSLMSLAVSLGVEIDVKADTLQLIVTPKQRITPELREALQRERDELVRILLHRRAGEWLDRVVSGKPQKVVDAATRAYLEQTDSLNTLWQTGTLEEFRDVLKEGMRLAREVLLDELPIQNTRQVLELWREWEASQASERSAS